MTSSLWYSSMASTSIPGLIIFCTSFYIQKLESAQFSVIGPDQPVTAVVGQDIILSCHLSPRMSAENMEVRWFQNNFETYVHLYRDGRDYYEQQMPKYQKRTELLKDGIMDGNISLKILNIERADEGQYNCFVQDGITHDETILDLHVAVLGSVPLISVEDYQDGGIHVVCQSAGWFPEPKLVWRDPSGQHLPSVSETKAQKDNGLFEAATSIVIKEYTNSSLSCWIRDKYLSQGKESAVYISDQFFPWVNPWMVALIVILVILSGFLVLIIYFCKLRTSSIILNLPTYLPFCLSVHCLYTINTIGVEKRRHLSRAGKNCASCGERCILPAAHGLNPEVPAAERGPSYSGRKHEAMKNLEAETALGILCWEAMLLKTGARHVASSSTESTTPENFIQIRQNTTKL
ncbi:putative selection and upkeep of intraepithelial T-cells protein 1 homolog isoform X9 [Alligator sinensis]|uniref:Selection and upkeep of intraepithelial T-cells protein 1 homolog isoform X9 n=1 Tax=Alligator sinensis TaxID=38654 RepID=A0A3Q0FYG7_ALLSI|nr:putative selection and upkeep of intraepithelial T-cells protein 1 homolog isoform X9 [Alligator sinensis]